MYQKKLSWQVPTSEAVGQFVCSIATIASLVAVTYCGVTYYYADVTGQELFGLPAAPRPVIKNNCLVLDHPINN